HDSLDERAGSFFALGQARVTGRPSLLICTSGTAAAHYLPAVVEASLSYTPLLVLTADRPLELQDCAAPQTVDQIKLMGDHVRRFYELGTPEGPPSALIGLRRLAAQAVHYALWPTPGPVHVNARARKPLDPTVAATAAGAALEVRGDELIARPIVASPPTRCSVRRASGRATAPTWSCGSELRPSRRDTSSTPWRTPTWQASSSPRTAGRTRTAGQGS